jgi:hypothetical protein
MNLSALSTEELKERLTHLEEAYAAEKGRTAEVYARIVGYYRSVRNWNAGKRQEFGERLAFGVNEEGCEECGVARVEKYEENPAAENATATVKEKMAAADALFTFDEEQKSADVEHYQFFYRTTCPNCIPVKEFLSGIAAEGQWINVDDEAGLAEAADKRVFAAPTVIFYDTAGNEVYRSSKVEEISGYFIKAA